MTNNVISEEFIEVNNEDFNDILNNIIEESFNQDIKAETNESDNQENNTSEILDCNSPELLLEDTTVRFSGAEWFDSIKKLSITLAGLGGIGSWTSLLLSRLNIKSLYLFDFDKVDASNLGGQFYSIRDINLYKSEALADHIKSFSNFYDIFAYHRKIENESSSIMICGFDNMEARKKYFENWMHHVKESASPNTCLFIDGRVSAEELQIFCLTGDDTFNIDRYQKEYLFSDNEAESEICSYKQTTFITNMIASLIANLVVNFVANQCDFNIKRDLPFFTYYDAKLMLFKTEN